MRIADYLKEKTGITIAGEKVLTFKAYDKRTFDSVRFKKEHPAMYQQYVNVSTNRIMKTF